MSAPKVDVLAAIAGAVAGLHETGQNKYASDLLEARAAAAELIEVARMVIRSNDMNRWGDSCQPIVNAAHAALARAGVAQ